MLGEMLAMVMVGLAALSLLVSAIGSLGALLAYSKRDGASLFGFGFANYFYGQMRNERPRLFWMSIGGALGAFACLALGAALG